MALTIEHESNSTWGLCRLSIDEDLTIYSIESIKQALSEEIEIYQTFELNLAKVEEFDSAGIQLLLALSNELSLKNKQLKLTAVSPVVSALIESYGIRERFEIGEAA